MMDEKVHILDTSGLLCPLPLVKLSMKIKEVKEGEVIKVIATDKGLLKDVPAWCKDTGNECIEVKEEEGKYVALVRKRAV